MKVLLHHFDFLLYHVELRLDGFAKILGRILKAFDRFTDLPTDFRQFFWAKQEKGDDQNYEDLTCAQSKHDWLLR